MVGYEITENDHNRRLVELFDTVEVFPVVKRTLCSHSYRTEKSQMF